MSYEQEVAEGKRFEFGSNWKKYLKLLTDERINDAEKSLKNMLNINNLAGKRFIDIGSGSGLFSLAAKKLDATVFSFDYDPNSVSCGRELKRKYYPDDNQWVIEKGSVLDKEYIKSLGKYDVVYSWGVLHHTGAMWQALENVSELVSDDGELFIAIYNDQGFLSRYWLIIKKIYNLGIIGRAITITACTPYFLAIRLLQATTFQKKISRGMDYWRDVIDWLGGLPFEVAKPEDILSFYVEKGFYLYKMKTCAGRMGCNEYVFKKHLSF